jgi:DNA-binding MarR family transcriptional regulator
MEDSAELLSLGRLLVRVMVLHRGHVHEALERLGLYRGQAFILHVLWDEEGLMQSELAARTWVQPATMTTALQRMEQAGLIERHPDADDQRVSRVYLTEAGKALEGPVKESFQEIEARTFAGFGADERERLRCFLEQIAGNLEEEDDEHA